MAAATYRILFVDDSPEDRELYQRLLTQGGEDEYCLVQADTGEAGLRLLRQDSFDCVLLDYQLPDRDGLELLAEWTQANMPLTAIVMITGQGNEAVAVEAFKQGAQDYLIKSRLTAEKLRQVVRTAIEKVTLLRKIEAQRRELERRATVDDLTGLHNRRTFMERLDEEIARAKRYGAPLSVILIDVDHFKRINDSHGHLVGDRVLAEVARTIAAGLRRPDFICRYGGEEFCILAADTDLHGAHELAERLRILVSSHICVVNDAWSVQMTCSFGVAELNERLGSAEQLLAKADTALYEAKAAGRNCVGHAAS
jgi:diguanylate cyclase (GGDEF)-like protein